MAHIEEFHKITEQLAIDGADQASLDRLSELYQYVCAMAAQSEQAVSVARDAESRLRWPDTTGQ